MWNINKSGPRCGGGKLPGKTSYLFDSMRSIKDLERTFEDRDISCCPVREHKIIFNDSEFRKYTSMNLSSTRIHDPIHETSKVEFKLCFPVRMGNERGDINHLNASRKAFHTQSPIRRQWFDRQQFLQTSNFSTVILQTIYSSSWHGIYAYQFGHNQGEAVFA